MKHKLRFFISPGLLTATGAIEEAQRRLKLYARDLQALFANTGVEFQKADSLVVVRDTIPHTRWHFPAAASHPDWPIGVWAQWSQGEPSRGGSMAIDESGERFSTDHYWKTIHDPDNLGEGDHFGTDFEDYHKRQLRHIAHEIGHAYGLAIGELYSINTAEDKSGVEPIVHLDETNEFFTKRHPDWQGDIMSVGMGWSRLALEAFKGSYWHPKQSIPVADPRSIRLRILVNGAPVAANIRIWRGIKTVFREHLSGQTGSPYPFVWDYGGSDNEMLTDNLRLVLVEAGALKLKFWISIYEAQELALVHKQLVWQYNVDVGAGTVTLVTTGPTSEAPPEQPPEEVPAPTQPPVQPPAQLLGPTALLTPADSARVANALIEAVRKAVEGIEHVVNRIFK